MPTTQERIARVLLKVQVDRAELTNTQKQLDSFNKTMADLERSRGLSRLAQDASKAVSEGKSLRVTIAQLKAELVKFGATDKEVAGVVREFDRLRQSAEAAANAAGKATGRNAVQRIGSEVRALPAIPLGGGLSTDAIGKVVATLGGLGTAGTAAALGIGAAIVALKASTAGIESTVRSIIATQEEYFRAIATGTRESIQAAIDAKKIEIDIKRAQVEESRRIFEGLEAQVGGVGRALSDVLDLGGSRQLREELQKNEQELRNLEFGVGRLQQALNNTEVATRSAAEAEKELADAREAIADARVTAQIAAELQVSKLSAEATRERIQAINDEMRLNLEYSQSADISSEKVAQLTQRSRDLAVELRVLTNALPEKERVEAAKELFDKLKDGLNDLIKDTAKNFKDLQKVTQEIGELKSDFRQKIIDIQNKLAEQLAEAARDRDIALSEAQREADMARTEAVREAGLERAEIERDSQIAITRILRRSKIDINAAIQDRNAVALDAARARRKEELDAEESNRAERLRKLDIELRKQLQTIDARLKEQNRTIAMRYDEQVRRAALAAQKSIEIETAKFNRELALKAQEAAKILQLEQQKIATTISGANQALGVTAVFWQNMVTVARNAVAALNNSAAKVATPSGRPSASSGGKVPSMAVGGKILSDGLIFAHAGETVIPARNRNQSQGQIVFAPQINGLSKSAVRREVLRQFDQWVTDVLS